MISFKAILDLCGMTEQCAADFLKVELPTIQAWTGGERPSREAVEKMAVLFETIQNAADLTADVMAGSGLGVLHGMKGLPDLSGGNLPEGPLRVSKAMALLMIAGAEQSGPSGETSVEKAKMKRH